jgi:maleylpyruvate isomerase
MGEAPLIPRANLLRVAEAQEGLMATIERLTDEDARGSTLLPGWTVGHILTHVARNADSHRRRAEAATRGEIIEQYAGGFAGRADEIEVGSVRSATELLADVDQSATLLQSVWEHTPGPAWLNPTTDIGGRERPLSALPSRRWQELEVHVVDLRLGPTHREWSDDFVEVWLPRLRASLRDRLPDGAQLPTNLDERDELAWLYGRLDRPDLPALAPWG